MCFCDPSIRTPYCNSKECQDEAFRTGWGKLPQEIKPEPKSDNIYLNYGWICPRCQRVHSPNIPTCKCNN